MTLHWWMHWFWITSSKVILAAILLVISSEAAPSLDPYTLLTSQKAKHFEPTDGSSATDITDITSFYTEEHHLPHSDDSKLHEASYHPSTVSNGGVSSLSSVFLVDSVPTVGITDIPYDEYKRPSARTYTKPLNTEASDTTPLIVYKDSSASNRQMPLHPAEEHIISSVSDSFAETEETSVVSDSDENVPVKKPTFISVTVNEQNYETEETTTSIISVPNKNAAINDSSIMITLKDTSNTSFPSSVSNEMLNIQRLRTRELKNNSKEILNSSTSVSVVASHESDQAFSDPPALLSSQIPQPIPYNSRSGKAVNFFPSLPLHSIVFSTTTTSSKNESEVFPLPPTSDTSDVIHGIAQGFKQGPKSSDQFLRPFHIEDVAINGETKVESDDSRKIWVMRSSPYSNVESGHGKVLPVSETDIKSNPLDDMEMADSPHIHPKSSTVNSMQSRNSEDDLKPPPIPSSDHEIDVGDSENKSSDPGNSKEKGRVKVIPPMLATINKNTSQSGRVPENGTKSSHALSVSGNATIKNLKDSNDSSSGVSEIGKVINTKPSVQAVSSSVPGVNQVTNVTLPVKDVEENETTTMPTVVPISNGRVAAAFPNESHHGLDAASITGISLGILVFAALVGAVSFVLYRRRFLNKPQTLNDKCSNPDSSGYIDDSTLRENSEEMYSLDNDSFLNSLEAMTIQNYWTDNVKHTKL